MVSRRLVRNDAGLRHLPKNAPSIVKISNIVYIYTANISEMNYEIMDSDVKTGTNPSKWTQNELENESQLNNLR